MTADPQEAAASPRRVFVHGISTAVPGRALTQAEFVERIRIIYRNPRSLRLIRRLAERTNIARRHLAALDWQDGGAARPPLYLSADEQPRGPGMGPRNARFDEAAAELIQRAGDGFSRCRLDATRTLVTVSCTHASSPGLERPVFRLTPVRHDVQRWNLGFMGCSAGLAALRLVHGLAPEQQAALIVTCELSSLHFQYHDAPDQITANMLFADGAALVALSAEPSAVSVEGCRCVNLPEVAEQMVWFADDHGLRLELARELPETLGAHLAGAVDALLHAHGLARHEIAHWVVHPGGPQILDSVEAVLGLAPAQLTDSRAVLCDYGNMSSSTVFFILQRLIERRQDGFCVALAFGPGLTIELALLEINRERSGPG